MLATILTVPFVVFGIILLVISLAFDGFNNTGADKLKKQKKMPSAFVLMVTHNFIGCMICFAELAYNPSSLAELPSEAYTKLAIIGFSGAIGQCFIFLTIANFDCFILTTVTTTRKFFSILFSIIAFGHSLITEQYYGMALIFFGISLDAITSEMRRRKAMKAKTE